MVVVLIGLLVGLVIVSGTLKNWSDNPEKVAIKTFSQPAREVPYPAITICNPKGYDVGEYIRAIFDNFEFSCEKGKCDSSPGSLRADFPGFSSESGALVNHIPCSLGIEQRVITPEFAITGKQHVKCAEGVSL